MLLRRVEERGVSFTLPRVPRSVRLAAPATVPRWLLPEEAADNGCAVLRELEAGELRQVGRSLPFAGGPDWRMTGGRSTDRLWTYHVHYHDWIAELAAAYARTGDARFSRAALRWVQDWIRECRPGAPGFTHYAWNSFATATRLGAWGRLWAWLGERSWREFDGLQAAFATSLHMQAQYLARHIEWDLRGNHLLRDVVGLAWAGRIVEGVEGDAWRRQATRLLLSQVDEQVLTDGGHFERSSVYQRQVMDDIATAVSLLDDPALTRQIRPVWTAMAELGGWLRFPDGSTPLLNDAAANGAPELAHVTGVAVHAGLDSGMVRETRGTKLFADTGYLVHHGMPWMIVFNVGSVGPSYQPGHAHADTLQLCGAVNGIPLLIDPGAYDYDRGVRRAYSRSTAAHNTVAVDGVDSSEMWDIFRVGRRAKVIDLVFAGADGEERLTAGASHDGYRHLTGAPVHRRTVSLQEGSLKVVDEVSSSSRHRLSGGWLLAHGWSVRVDETGWALTHRSGAVVTVTIAASPPAFRHDATERELFPAMGEAQQTTRLEWEADVKEGEFRLVTRFAVAAARRSEPCPL